MESKVTLLLTKARGGFHLNKNGGSGTKPAYKFIVINSLLAIELKVTPKSNPTNDFYWKQKSSSLNVMQYNISSRSIIFSVQI